MLYRNLSGYLKEKYGRRLSKICIDGGFSCPNRDGTCGFGGCIFCGERGAGEHIFVSEKERCKNAVISIGEQVRTALSGRGEDELFIAYFQNFTNTYADIETLRARYDAALIDDRIKILAIGTRPDCIDERIADLIATYNEEREVWVELGLQTASNATAKIINRGYTTDVFLRAIKILASRKVKTVVHLMIGLPGEGDAELADTVRLINSVEPFGVKIHSVYVSRGTVLEKMYDEGKYTPISLEDYTRRAAYVISHLSAETVIHRLTGDCPVGLLRAPDWNTKKSEVIAKITEKLDTGGLKQGSCYKKGEDT